MHPLEVFQAEFVGTESTVAFTRLLHEKIQSNYFNTNFQCCGFPQMAKTMEDLPKKDHSSERKTIAWLNLPSVLVQKIQEQARSKSRTRRRTRPEKMRTGGSVPTNVFSYPN